jgi:Na+-transporting methylmalonyl-CoA/oxaloacetate decarboxylase gamma subunit
MDLLQQGLQLSLVGIAVTFSALGLLILIIVLLQRFFNEPPASAGGARQNKAGETDVMGYDASPPDAEIAAAIAIAIEHFSGLQAESAGLGTALAHGPGPWWHRQQLPNPPTVEPTLHRSDRT